MLSTLLSLGALLVTSSIAQYPPAYLTASDVYGIKCSECGMSASYIDPPSLQTQLITIDLVGAFGEGTNVAILTNDTSKALTGQFNNTYWTFNGFSKIHSLYMEPTASSKEYPRTLPVLSSARKSNALTLEIADYGKVGINSGLATKGFSEGDEDGLLVWNNTGMANVGSWFAFCPTLIPGHESAGLQDRVYWQSNEAPAEGTNNCTTVVIHGAFE